MPDAGHLQNALDTQYRVLQRTYDLSERSQREKKRYERSAELRSANRVRRTGESLAKHVRQLFGRRAL